MDGASTGLAAARAPAPQERGGSVKDVQGDTAYGRVNWRRFAVAVGIPAVVAGGMLFGMANGAFAASFAVSGQAFKISADRLEGDGFAQDASTLTKGGAAANGAVGQFGQQADDVTITGLRQTAVSTTAGTFTLNGLQLKLNV